ncbi:thiol peroxidase [Zhihengliuella sp.]|uniref:thiol peroxidase n=1 Tax=Zhihengliuella sp. TaxID=1954483 RepID=UPI0028112226|nr:thiol peroxidase [Zhihengliuella sp.]
MTDITLQGSPVSTVGELPAVGSQAPEFTLVGTDLSEVSSADFAGQRVLLNIFPSLDTDVCAASVRTFNQRAAELENTAVVCVSADLPFALGRFCGDEGIENVVAASSFRSSFAQDFGTEVADGPLAGLNSRAIVLIDADGKVSYTQQVPEITDEPDYDAAVAAIS